MTALTESGVRAGDALRILPPGQTALLRELDRVFTGWGGEAGAAEILPPPLYPVRDLEKFDVYTNFPHLAMVGAALDLDGAAPVPSEGRFAAGDLAGAAFGLPHATCYGAYLYYENASLAEDTLITLVNRCFRNEERYGGLRRLLSFQMREIVALGSYAHTQKAIEQFTTRILEFAGALGLPMEKLPAADPFFQNDGSRALLAKLSPVKYEFQVGDLAIASVNTHRNFFGERCGIRLEETGEHACTSCVAFGLERWVAVLLEAHGDDAEKARDAVVRAAGQVS